MIEICHSPARARLAAAFAVLCLGLVLASCGSSSATKTTSAAQTSSQPAPTASSPQESQEPVAPTGHMSANARKVFEGFVTCMRKHGIDYPALNLSGKGPAVKQTPLNRDTPQFKAARVTCATALATALKALGVGKSEAQTG